MLPPFKIELCFEEALFIEFRFLSLETDDEDVLIGVTELTSRTLDLDFDVEDKPKDLRLVLTKQVLWQLNQKAKQFYLVTIRKTV